MSLLPAGLRAEISRRHHTIPIARLLEAGVERRQLSDWLATRTLVELAPGVVAVGDAVVRDPFTTRAAALSSDPSLVCDAVTSARCWRLPGVFRSRRPSMIDRTTVPDHHVTRRDDGLSLLTPAATWFALASVFRPGHFATWSDAVLGSAVTVVDAHEVVRARATPKRAADRRAALALSTHRRWQRPPDPGLERRVRASFRRRGLTGLDGAHRLDLDPGVTIHPTVTDHRRRWAIEIDHVGWHGGRWSVEFTDWIDRCARRAGWTILRVDDRALRADLGSTMSDLITRLPSASDAA